MSQTPSQVGTEPGFGWSLSRFFLCEGGDFLSSDFTSIFKCFAWLEHLRLWLTSIRLYR